VGGGKGGERERGRVREERGRLGESESGRVGEKDGGREGGRKRRREALRLGQDLNLKEWGLEHGRFRSTPLCG
jgi:hypothetical protein